ncbi:acyltransferase family protein [Armatimonas rosea]|uniref:Peptidoglycan/LPS O-acetylase OafA/YrhL n=1 Tax=Armatimonas rosea TaxID=685828 RepID=A0A7W9SV56_ARMRO|nr:acyltransferase [Armatimonas rosea]MBB6052794.1 peptidoglycan/LPS O-acetylase OafA/YrhL [Armatimonas rosea]
MSKVAERLYRIDTLRFFLALCVVCFHLARSEFFAQVAMPHALRTLLLGLFNGQAAVVAFFLISGLCIHFPFRKKDKPLALGAFYTRRLVRISTPLLVALGLSLLIGCYAALSSVMWSLYCEIVYYALYPLFLWVSRRTSWTPLLAVFGGLSAFLIYSGAPRGYMHEFGPFLNWLVWLPLWLLGCRLAENTRFPKLSTLPLWLVRAAMVILASLCLLATWKSSVGLPRTVFLLAFPAYFWIAAEVGSFVSTPLAQRLESLGAWSYSLYLVHPMLLWAGDRVFKAQGQALPLGVVPVALGAALGIAYGFYLLVEKPSVRLARVLGERVK